MMNFQEIANKKEARIYAGEKSLQAFGTIYFPHYVTFPSASFQKEYCNKLENEDIPRLAECDFRESGKSVWTTLIYPIHQIVYNLRNFIIIGSETSGLATLHLSSIINALQANEIIKEDFGELYKDLRKEDFITRKKTVNDFITENNVRIMAKGRGESVRGLRHLQYRPDLFIGDDLDSNNSVINLEQRDKLYNWIKAEVLSGMNQEYGKAVIIGNMIHFDCIMARLKKDSMWNYREVPIYKEDKLAWPSRYFWGKGEADKYNENIKNKEKKKTSIEQIKDDKGSLVFAQEYLLQPLSNEERIFKPEWIQYYEEVPPKEFRICKGRIDPAAKEKETSDYSAIAIGCREKRSGKIYILDVWQGKVSEEAKADMIYRKHTQWDTEEFIVEDNAYQDVLRQRVVDMSRQGKYVPVRGVTTLKDKVTRALAVQPYIERGDVLFNPKLDIISKIQGDNRSQGAIEQMIQFPSALNDDMVDAIIGVIERLIKNNHTSYKTNEETQNETANLMTKTF
jgi:predicted phage terminase large subunit-like protein